VRDTMAKTYANIDNGFIGADSRFDLIRLKDSDTYIDFVAGPDTEGILVNKLQWNKIDYNPGGGGGDGGGGGGGGEPTGYLEPNYNSFKAALDAWPNSDKYKYHSNLKNISGQFRDWLAQNYVNAERVNDQWDRHRYRETDWWRHTDAIVIIRDVENPSMDIIVDFMGGVSGPGYMYKKLQCLWHEGPYTWWVDNAFLLGVAGN